MASSEEILDSLSTLIFDLGSIRERTTNQTDRDSINDQITALTGLWREIDDARAGEADDRLTEAAGQLDDITRDIKREKQKLEDVAKVIERAAQAIAVAEKVVKLVA